MTSLRIVELLLMVITVSGSEAELLVLYNSLNPKTIPFIEFAGGSCQDARILVEVNGVMLKLVGAWLGPLSVSEHVSKNTLALLPIQG